MYIFWILHQTTTYLRADSFGSALYIFWILHQTTTWCRFLAYVLRCISFESYIKPQLSINTILIFSVVYLLNPTSNHNSVPPFELLLLLYIFWILHQTTTYNTPYIKRARCISFESYIKPQLSEGQQGSALRCISFESYIKPQQIAGGFTFECVVYLLNPTSNHNSRAECSINQ